MSSAALRTKCPMTSGTLESTWDPHGQGPKVRGDDSSEGVERQVIDRFCSGGPVYDSYFCEFVEVGRGDVCEPGDGRKRAERVGGCRDTGAEVKGMTA